MLFLIYLVIPIIVKTIPGLFPHILITKLNSVQLKLINNWSELLQVLPLNTALQVNQNKVKLSATPAPELAATNFFKYIFSNYLKKKQAKPSQ